jgi:hypothetical protein
MSPYLKIEKPIKAMCLDASTALKISFFDLGYVEKLKRHLKARR